MQLQLTASPRKFLQVLLWMRLCALLGQSITIAVVWRWLGASLPVAAMGAVIAVLALIAAMTALRLRTTLPATQAEVSLQLLIDIAELTVLLYLSGGTTNPFASLYLLPVALAAVALAWQWSALIALSCLGCYAWLITHHVALAAPHNPVAAFSMHVAGMHVTFAISAVLLAAVLAVMAAEMRRRDQAVAALREEALRREHLGAMGVLAAGAAHELSTPLFSMAMLVSELKAARRMDQGFRDDLELLGRQIQLCKDKLTTLLQAAGRARGPQTRTVALRDALRTVLDDWTIVRPAVRLEVDWQGLRGQPLVSVDEGFPQALTSLLDNAADASAARGSDLVRLAVAAGAREVRLFIDDEGPGLDPQMQQRAGKALFSTKPGGFGLGLVLSHVNLNRLRGDVTLTNRASGGTRTMIVMPVCAAGRTVAVLENATAARAGVGAAVGAAMPGDRVLIVEDDAVASQLLARALNKHGYLVETAAGVQEALAVCERWPAQAAVIDLKLGSESGLKLLPALLRARPGIRVLMLTGYASVATAVQAIKMGASDYLAKPIEVTEIIRVLSGNGLQALREVSPGRPSVRRLEWEYIQKVLAEHDGNISETARILGIQRRTLQRKLSRRPAKT